MAWKIELDRAAKRDLAALDHGVATRILQFLNDRLAQLDDPRAIGEALRGPALDHLWKYRVGDYRVIAQLDDGTVTVIVVRIGNRREIYRR